MDYQQIKYEVEDRILTITLNRPARMNAYTEVMREELIDAINCAEADDEVRAIIVTGAGRAFCAGMDLGDRGATFDYTCVPQDEHRDGGGLIALRMYRCTKPIIAAINGAAVGIGLTMTLPMDIRIAAHTAKMGIVFARRGIVVDACSSWFLPRVVGISKALDWSMTGRVFSAQEAFESGLVSQLVEPDQVIPAARAVASEIARYSAPVSVALIRQLMWSMLGASHPMEAHRIESKGFHYLGQRADAAEGINAFLEKRDPRFSMSPYKDMPDFYPWSTEPPFKG
ncbi:MAG TPA: crotonase/enoyl-CoA hydratase family protein [Syntrophomonadaceae bacterium]|nr:crotonase/enoyl-CoA hydratase family protein [Syntrophomonadaceae bacterium]HQA08010.1 crotonase/enoyl-CoA hydratase family protein [Syntrophomonadaceae bacterium]HQE23802.1 crotonase/enoyl-CoA hydratase family protein [Syntrophomonadaceae bacterium]